MTKYDIFYDELYKTTSSRIKDLRISQNISQEMLAEYLGITGATLSRYENGLYMPKLIHIKKMAVFFNTTTDYLLGLKDTP